MDAAEREGGFSSQNARILSTYRRGANGRAQVELSDGSSFFITESLCEKLIAAKDTPIGDALFEEIKLDSNTLLAWDKSLEFLGRRDHSSFELSRKLHIRGFSKEVITSVLARLTDFGYLDDSRFAQAWVRARLKRHPEGRSHLVAGLAQRGVNRGIIQITLDTELSDEVMEESIIRAAEKLLRRGYIEPIELQRKLLARGFTYRQAQEYLQYL